MSSLIPTKTTLVFWSLGLLNNIPFVIMLACAKSISEGGTALVFLASNVPGLLMKLSSPYWFDKIDCDHRIFTGSVLMGASFFFVAVFGYLEEQSNHLDLTFSQDYSDGGLSWFVAMQLVGVAMCSAQCDLGEASLLALSGRVDSMQQEQQREDFSQRGRENDNDNNGQQKSMCITAFSSGTGIAGILGFGFVFFCTNLLQISLHVTLLFAAMVFPTSYWTVYSILPPDSISRNDNEIDDVAEIELLSNFSDTSDPVIDTDDGVADHPSSLRKNIVDEEREHNNSLCDSLFSGIHEHRDHSNVDSEIDIKTLSPCQRLSLTCSLWPYMIPLFTVYAAEYALQSGVWTGIGFPINNEDSRNDFYVRSNWSYQLGVFISRSSGGLFLAPMWFLWLMPFLQVINLFFFYAVAVYQFWYNYSLVILCFYVGLLGGGVYVNGYMRINKDMPITIREFALSTVSVADSFGIMFADISGLFIQSCLYKHHDIQGALVKCPV